MSVYARALRTSLAATTSGLVLALAASPANAQCVVDGDAMADASMPESGQTITCADNLDNDGVLNSQANNVTVNVESPAGGISVTGQAGVLLGDGATISVASGSNRPINTSGDNAAGIEVGNGASIDVGGQVTTAGEMSDAISANDMATIDVSGTVRTGGGTSNAILVGATSTVNVKSGGLVTTGNSNSSAIRVEGDGSTVNVAADADVTTSSGMSNPILLIGNDATVNVAGDVRSSSGNATAILAEGNGASITIQDGGFVTAQSSGSNGIESTGSNAVIVVESGGEVRISSGNSSAIVSGDMGTVELAGTVNASSSQSQGVVLNNGGSLTIVEGGVITTSSSESQAVLVDEAATSATITVETDGMINAIGAQAVLDRGMTNTMITVDGEVFGGSSDPVLDLGAGDDTVIVNGTVEGSSASPVIDLGDGSDTLTINSSTTVTGPDVLADLGGGTDTLNLNSGQTFASSQFAGAETVNANQNTLMGDPNMGSGTTYNIDDDQSGQTVNSGSGSTTNVQNGGSVMTINSDGGTSNVENGGSAMNANSSNGGTTNVNDGGMVSNSMSSSGGTTNVNEGGMVMNASSSDGGMTNINSGGSAMNSSADQGGSVTVGDGGDAGNVQSNTGGNVTVQSGGSANVNSTSGNGGNLTFESGSNANVESGASARQQDMEIAGADFQDGSILTVTNSDFITASASGSGISMGLADGAFRDGLDRLGVSNINSLSVANGLDAIAQAQTDDAALDALGDIVLTQVDDIPDVFNAITNEGGVQVASASLQASQQFINMLRPGARPAAATSTTAMRSASPINGDEYASGLAGAGSGQSGVWFAFSYGERDVDASAQTALESKSQTYSAGYERAIGSAGDAAVGIAIGYTQSDARSTSINDADIDSYSLGIYGGGTFSALRTNVALAYTRSNFSDAVNDSNGDIYSGRARVAVDLLGDADQGVNVAPFITAEGTLARYDDFAATGPINTVLTDGRLDQGVLGAGARIGFEGSPIERFVNLGIEAAYERVFGDRDLAFGATIGGTANAFQIIQTVADKERLRVGATFGVDLSDSMALSLEYDALYGSTTTDQAGSVKVTFRF